MCHNCEQNAEGDFFHFFLYLFGLHQWQFEKLLCVQKHRVKIMYNVEYFNLLYTAQFFKIVLELRRYEVVHTVQPSSISSFRDTFTNRLAACAAAAQMRI